MTLPITLVAAVAENGVIGTGGGLPWRVRADMRRFRAVTMGKPVVMGRKTFESIGRPLDGRDLIVVTRQKDFAAERAKDGVRVAASLADALVIAGACAAARGAEEICVAGGGEIYREAMPLADTLQITHVAASPEGDTHFPPIAPAMWAEVAREPLPQTEGDTAAAVHVVYRKRR